MTFYATTFIFVLFSVLRFVLPSTGEIHQADIPKDIAHIFVGWLLCGSVLCSGPDSRGIKVLGVHVSWWRIELVTITILECIAFYISSHR